MKYEEIYLFEHANIIELCVGLEKWFHRYNDWRPHQALGNQAPAAIYQSNSEGQQEESSEQAV